MQGNRASRSQNHSVRRILRRGLNYLGRKVMGTLTRVETREPVMALTFDDGPHPVYTPQLLDILDENSAKATFFMLGAAAERQPRLVKKVADAGHTIGNHSYDHPSFPLIPGRERRKQIRKCERAILPGRHRFFRPPFGDLDTLSDLDVRRLGYSVVTWDVVAEDWLNLPVARMASRMIEKARPGSIILLHDALALSLEEDYCGRNMMHEALNLFLKQLGSDFRFVTVNELLRYGRPVRKVWRQAPTPEFIDQLNLPKEKYF